jgi:hypothetical protein
MRRVVSLGVALTVSGFLLPPARANEVVWTATGTVTSSIGAGFTPLATVGQPVEIELHYDDDAPAEPLAIGVFPGLFIRQEYRQDVNIDLRVTIGGSMWRGTLGTGSEASGTPYTIEVEDFEVGPGTTDLFKVRTDASDGASFSSFPGGAQGPGGAGNSIELEFRSAVSDSAAEPN